MEEGVQPAKKKPEPKLEPEPFIEVVETLIFLDIDGVLNVGIQDAESSKLPLFNEANFSIARKLLKGDERSDAAEMLLSVMRMHTCDGNSSTYGDFLSRNDVDVCDIFLHRFVKIIRAAGDVVRVIISSSWRKPQYAANLQSLEKIVSGYLGKRFRFYDHTALVDEVGGHDRLRLIGDYIEMHCSKEEHPTRINLLVLDDFFYLPVSGFDINGTKVDSIQSAESYLEARVPPNIASRARIIHTYLSSLLPSGLEVQIGTGLSLQHLNKALMFLGSKEDNTVRPDMAEGVDVVIAKQLEPVETLIFLDIDGVLNVGIADPGSAPLSFNEANFSVARKLFRGSEKNDVAEMLIAVMRMHTCDGNSSTYGDFLSRNDLDVCDIFIHRLVNIIRAAGEKVRVIISSSWRRPKYSANVRSLEKMISGYLGETFSFYDRTPLEDEVGGHDRLRLIGDYIEMHCRKEESTTKFNVLVLDDFFYKPINDFNCGGTTVNSLQSAESYIEARAPPATAVNVRIIHTYMNSLLPSGLEVQIGTGLSLQHLSRALGFLGATESLNVFRADRAAEDVDVATAKGLEPVETLIFLDIDGVLNVGIADPGSAPLSFNEDNFSIARKLFKCNKKSDAAEMLLSVMRMRTCDGNSSTYGDFLSRNDLDVCDIFIHRLVKVIRAAGEKVQVIISSSWRRPKYAAKLRSLEKMMSGYLGETFKFTGCTTLADEVGGSDRLVLIGDYIEMHCGKEEHTSKVSVLVIDDFFYLPITGFNCAGTAVNSVQSAESYLQGRAPPGTEAKVRIIHTYMNSLLPSGLEVQVGTGLSLQHLGEALAFLAATRNMHICLPEAEDVDVSPSKDVEPVDTLIFLDIDGVLNVGIADPVTKPLSFNEANCSSARRLFKGSEKNDVAEMLMAVMRMYTCDGNSSTYGDFLSRNDLDVCDIFVHRLVKIIRAAGEKVRVIISSSWRRPQYASHLQSLEKIISGYLGKKFAFCDKTAIVDESGRHVRLRLIGDYIAAYCGKDEELSKLKVIVLDDFFYLPVNGFSCGETVIDSLQSAESYLQVCAPSSTEAEVKIIHTYMNCTLPSGSEVHVGTGLSLQHLHDTLVFLGARRRSKPKTPEASTPTSTKEDAVVSL